MVDTLTQPLASRKIAAISCAIYTRKSTDENLDSGFTSLDSQRECCQSFIKSREGEGWRVYPEEYNDPGFSGGNMNRPALRKLLADAAQKKFQVLVCYKYDRLSRNTRDFLHILDTFDKHGVAFVSVTQPIDTTSSVGRLMRSILMDFSQFEREMISERTRDKLHAMAKKGKRTGGRPILGYDIDPETKQFRVNPSETKQLLEIFDRYNETKSLCATAKLLNSRGFKMKAWTTRKGISRGGQRFTKANLWYLLRNPVYLGKIIHRKETLPGEHPAIVPESLFESVNKLLRTNGDGKIHRALQDRKHNYLLRGLVQCASCNTTMTPSSALPKKNGKTYGRFYYYKCLSVVKMDKSACSTRSVSAKALETYVVKRLEVLSQNHQLIDRIVTEAQRSTSRDLPLRLDEKKRLAAEQGKIALDIKNLVAVLADEGPASPTRKYVSEQLAELDPMRQELVAKTDQLNLEIQRLENQRIDAEVLWRSLQNFLILFKKLSPEEQVELMQLLVQRVIYDKEKSAVQIALRPLAEAWGDLNCLNGGFYHRIAELPDLDSNQD